MTPTSHCPLPRRPRDRWGQPGAHTGPGLEASAGSVSFLPSTSTLASGPVTLEPTAVLWKW